MTCAFLRPSFLFVTILAEFLFPLMLVHLALFALTTTRHWFLRDFVHRRSYFVHR